MNKLFSKIAALSVGLAMAIGVGVAVGSKEAKVAKAEESYTETTFDNLATNDVVVIVGNNGSNYALGNNNGSSSAPSAVAVTVVGTSLSGTIPNTLLWKVTKSGTNIEFTVNGGTGKLTCGTANNGMRVDGDGGNSVFSIKDAYIFNSTNGRYVGIYNSQDWRCYTSINSNITGQTFKFFKQGSVGPVVSYTITYDANGGSGSMEDSINTVSVCTFTAPEGKRFKEWNTAANGSGTAYAEGASAASDLDLFAIWEEKPECVTLDSIGTSLSSTANTTMETVDIADGSDTYTLNYLQCKKQGDSMLMVKSVSPFISNHTEMPGDITSVEVFINSGASSKTTYDVAFGTSEYTTATAGIGAENITGGNSHVFENTSVTGAKFFCITLGNDNNGQVLKIVVNYESSVDPSKKNMTIYTSGNPADGATLLWSSTAGIHNFSAMEEENPVSGVTWSVSDTTVATIVASTGAMTTVKPGNVVVYAEAEGYNKASAAIEISKSWVEELVISGSMTKTSYTTAESWDASGLIVNASYHSGWEEDVTSSVEWSFNPATPAEGVTSVVATATLGEDSVSSPAQSVTVSVAHAGTAEDPFTVAEALAKANEIGTVGNTGQGPWVTTGIISRVTSAPAATYWNATYYISDDGSQNNELQVYRGFYLDNAKFDENTAQLLKAGKVATITGNLTGSYGCEYCQGNYLLALEDQETGDVDVVFEPSETSIEIGAAGTFTASSETSGVVFSWEVEDSSILSVNASSGAYEALALGVTKVTVTATAGGKEGSASAYITVNGANYMTVNAANELAATVPTGQTTGYYVYVEGFVSAFDVDSKTRALNITSKGEDSTIMVFVGASGYSAFIDGLQVGMCLRVKANVQNYNGTYELTNPVKEYSEYVAMTFAREFLDSTDAICEGYDGVSSNKAALEAIWSGFETKYDSLTTVQQNTLLNPDTYDVGSTIKDAMARYDYLTGKYELDNFVGRTPVVFAHINVGLNDVASDNNTMIIVVVIAAVSALAFTTLLVFKKKKQK